MAVITDPKTGIIVSAPKGSDQWTDAKRARRWLTWALSRVVSDTACASLPTSPVEGQAVIIASSATANANAIARYSTDLAAWEYLTPWAGLVVQDTSGAGWIYSGSSWARRSSGGGGSFSAALPVGEPATPSDGVELFADYGVANLVPTMTGNSAPSGVASASSEYNPAWYAFNDSISSGWLTNGASTGWLQYQFASVARVTSYAIRPWDLDNFPSRTPTAWTLQGSNNGQDWTTLDTRTVSSASWVSGAFAVFSVSTPGDYAYYRLTISAGGGNSYLGIHTLRLLGPSTAMGYVVWAKNSAGKTWQIGGNPA